MQTLFLEADYPHLDTLVQRLGQTSWPGTYRVMVAQEKEVSSLIATEPLHLVVVDAAIEPQRLIRLQKFCQDRQLPIMVKGSPAQESLVLSLLRQGFADYGIDLSSSSLDLLALKVARFAPPLQTTSPSPPCKQDCVIRKVANHLHQSLDLQITLDYIVAELHQVLATDRVIAYRFNPANGTGQVVAEALSAGWSSLLGQTIHDEYFATNMVTPYLNGRIQVTQDVDDGSLTPCHADLLRQIQVKAIVVVPVVYDDTLWGLLAAQHCQQAREWYPHEIELLQFLAGQVSLAIKQAELYTRTQQEIHQNQSAMAALARSTELYSSILESISDAVFLTNSAGRFTFISPHVEMLFGYSQGEILAMGTAQHLLGPDLFDPAELASWGELTNLERQIRDKAGNLHHLLITVKRVAIETGTLLYTCHDITERTQAEHQLQAQENHYRQLIEHLPAGVVVHGPDTAIVSANARACHLLELSLEQITGKTAIDPEWHFLQENGSPLPLEDYPVNWVMRHRSPLQNYVLGVNRPHSGTQIWALVNAYPIVNNDQGLEQIIVTFVDITDLKQAQSKLRDGEARFREAFEHMGVGMCISSTQGTFMQINQRFCQIVGYPYGQLVGKSFLDITHPDDIATDMAQVEQLLQGKRDSYTIEKRYIRQDGTIIWVNLTVSLMRTPEGEPQRFMGAIEDITARKTAEAKLQQLNHTLEQRIAERTQSLASANARLQDQTEALHQANQLLTLVMNSIPQRIFWKDRNSIMLGCNQHYAEDVGTTPEAAIGKGNHDFCATPEEAEFFTACDRQVMESGKPLLHVLETLHRHDGSVIYLDTSKVPLRNSDGEVIGLLGCYEDITERRQIEARLQQQLKKEKLLSSLMQRLRKTLNLEKILQQVTDQVQDLLGVDRVLVYSLDDQFVLKAVAESKSDFHQPLLGETLPREFFASTCYQNYSQGQLYVLKDRQTAPLPSCVTTFLDQLQSRAKMVVPIPRQGSRELWGLLVLHQFDRPRNWQPWETQLLQQLADHLGMAVKQIHLYEQLQAELREREHIAASLRESRRFIEQIANASPDNIYLYDLQEGHNVYTNREIAATLGYASEEIQAIGPQLLQRLMHPRDWERFIIYQKLLHQAEEDHVLEFEYRLRHANGTWRWMNSRDTVFSRDDQGRVKLIIGTAQDISARKREEAERRLAEQQLTERNQQLAKATRMKDEFLANMSHEIRTPMNAIIGMTQLALETPLNPAQRNYLGKIDKSAHILLRIINDILDFSKIEAGKLTLEQVPFCLQDVLQDLEDVTRYQAVEKGLALVFKVNPQTPLQLVGDPLRLGQVLTNLVANALKFTETGEVVVVVWPLLGQESSPQGSTVTLQFDVTDTGIGLNLEQQQSLFKAFSQGDASTTRRYGGTGLGLAISKQLVMLMGGEIGVESTAGLGSRFWFTANFLRDSRPALPSQPVPSQLAPSRPYLGVNGAACTQPPCQFDRVRLLVVEDNPINQELMVELLTRVGARVTVAENGQKALDCLASGSYDGVLMDCQMPVMDGYEATRRIRALPGGQALPIIAMTANAMARDRDLCLQAGMNDYLTKPISREALYHALQTWITPTEAEPAPEAAPAFAEFAGLTLFNIPLGLHYTGDNPELYHKVLYRFRAEYADFSQTLNQDLHNQDWPALTRLVHGLKGVAAMVGAEALQTAAATVEAHLRETAGVPPAEDLQALVEQWTAAMTELAQWSNATPASSPSSPEEVAVASGVAPIDWASAQPQLNAILPLLESDLVAAMEAVTRLQTNLQGDPTARQLAAGLAQALDRFDTEQAAALIHQLVDYGRSGVAHP